MTYYIKTDEMQRLLNNGDMFTPAMLPAGDFHSDLYVECDIPDYRAAQLFRSDVLRPPRARKFWTDDERSTLQNSFMNGVGMTKLALLLGRTEGEIYGALHEMFVPEDTSEHNLEESHP